MRGKIFLFLLLSLGCSALCLGQRVNFSASIEEKSGPRNLPEGVKAVSVLVSNPGLVKMQPFELQAEFYYDTQGRVVKSYSYDIDKSIWGEAVYTSMQEYKYNEKGQLIEHYREMNGGHYSTLTGYEYDADGRMSHIVHYNPDGSVRRRQEVNASPVMGQKAAGAQKRVVRDTLSNGFVDRVATPDGKLLAEQRTLFNEQGQVAHVMYANSKHQDVSIVNYKYDAEGKVVEEEVLDKKGNVVVKDNYTYSKSGFLMQITTRGKNDKTLKIVKYEYEFH